MARFFLLLLVFSTPLFFSKPLFARDWVFYANRLTGYSDFVREVSLKELSRMKDLTAILEKAFDTPEQYLALDVISALGKREMVDTLLKVSQKDESGPYYLCLNTLIHKENVQKFLQVYVRRLTDPKRPVTIPVRVILLDTLARMGYLFKESILLEMAEDRHPDVVSALISYSRLAQKRRGQILYPNIILLGLADPAPVIRLQTAHALLDLSEIIKPEGKRRFQSCTQDKEDEVSKVCKKALS